MKLLKPCIPTPQFIKAVQRIDAAVFVHYGFDGMPTDFLGINDLLLLPKLSDKLLVQSADYRLPLLDLLLFSVVVAHLAQLHPGRYQPTALGVNAVFWILGHPLGLPVLLAYYRNRVTEPHFFAFSSVFLLPCFLPYFLPFHAFVFARSMRGQVVAA